VCGGQNQNARAASWGSARLAWRLCPAETSDGCSWLFTRGVVASASLENCTLAEATSIAPQMVTQRHCQWRRLAATAAHGQLSISLRGTFGAGPIARSRNLCTRYSVPVEVCEFVLDPTLWQVSRIAFFSHQVQSERIMVPLLAWEASGEGRLCHLVVPETFCAPCQLTSKQYRNADHP
jgi:hypothetical protein